MAEEVRYFPSFDEEMADLIEFRREQAALDAAMERVGQTPQTAALLTGLRETYPWMNPGVALSLSQAGVPAGDPVATKAAEVNAHKKASRGLGWHSVGDALKKTGDVLSSVAQPVVRTGLLAAESGVELVGGATRGLARGIGEFIDDPLDNLEVPLTFGLGPALEGMKDSPPKASIALSDLLRGDRVDVGSGWLPDLESSVAQRQAQMARDTYSIDGHAGTPGRILAQVVGRPGDREYDILSGIVDFAVNVAADPVAIGAGKVAKVRQANKLFGGTAKELRKAKEAAGLVEAGGLKGVRHAVADNWLLGDQGREVVSQLTKEKSLFALYQTYKGKIPTDVLDNLARADSEDAVRAVLRENIGITIREKPKPLATVGARIRRDKSKYRPLGEAPGPVIDPTDLEGFVGTLDNFLLNVNMDVATREKYMRRVVTSANRNQSLKIVEDAVKDVGKKLGDELGMDAERVRKMTTMFNKHHEEMRRWWVDNAGRNVNVFEVVADDAAEALASPHAFVEHIQGLIPLPDHRALRRATGRLAKMEKVPGFEPTETFLEFMTRDVWKPSVLLRPAWTVRVVGEEQFRIAVAGHRSLINHPISAIAIATGRKLNEGVLPGEELKAAKSFANAMSRRGGGWWDHRVRKAGYTTVARGEKGYAEGLADELSMFTSDPVFLRVAGRWDKLDKVPGGRSGNNAQDVKSWFFNGSGKELRNQLAETRPQFKDRAFADRYIDSIADRLVQFTGGRQELYNAVRRGVFEGEPVGESRKLLAHIRKLEADQTITDMPQFTVSDLLVATTGSKKDELLAKKDRVLEFMFQRMGSDPTNAVSRGPEYAQSYWDEAARLMPFASEKAQDTMLAQARKTKVDAKAIRQMEKMAKEAVGDLDLEDIADLSHTYAATRVKDLLYDLQNKSQFADMMRVVFPFAEAWKEMLTTWAKLGRQNPAFLHRMNLGIQGAKENGIFYEDTQSGELVFGFPGSELVSQAFTGVPSKFEGSVTGLNLFADNPLLPGFGPWAQVAASKIIPDKPEWDWAREIVIPYGEIDVSKSGIVETFFPSWLKKIQQAWGDPADDVQYMSTWADILRSKASTGEYDLNDESEMRRLQDDTTQAAKKMFVLRGIGQAFAPTAPQPEFMIYDQNGEIYSQGLLGEEYQKMLEDDPTTATARFLDKYGTGTLFLLQSKTEGVGTSNKESSDWVRSNPEVARKYDEIFHWLAPGAGEWGDFDYTAWRRSIDEGTRRPLTEKEFIAQAQQRLGILRYNAVRDRIGDRPNEAGREFLRQFRERLIKEHPGYDPAPKDLGAVDRKIRQLYSAIEDPVVQATEVGKAAKIYLEARDKAMAQAQALGLTSLNSEKLTPIHAWLDDVAYSLIESHPDFRTIYESLLMRELTSLG